MNKNRLNIDLKTTLVGYHGHCTDGMGAAWAARRLGVPEENLHALNYGEPMPEVFSTHTGAIVFVDYRPPLADLRRLALAGLAQRIFVVDHHKAAWEEACLALPGNNDPIGVWFTGDTLPLLPGGTPLPVDLRVPQIVYIFDNERSGARLSWDFFQGAAHFIEEERPHLIDLIEDYDLWRKKLPLTEHLAVLLQNHPLSFERLDQMHALLLSEAGQVAVVSTAAAYLKMRDGLVEKAVASFGLTDLDGEVKGARFPVVNSSVFKNEIADKLLSRGYEVAVVWSHSPSVDSAGRTIGRCLYSLRSRGDVDVAAMARKFGGNGHKNAAGFSVGQPLTLLP